MWIKSNYFNYLSIIRNSRRKIRNSLRNSAVFRELKCDFNADYDINSIAAALSGFELEIGEFARFLSRYISIYAAKSRLLF